MEDGSGFFPNISVLDSLFPVCCCIFYFSWIQNIRCLIKVDPFYYIRQLELSFKAIALYRFSFLLEEAFLAIF